MIPISRPSEHAIRALTYLARQEGGGFCLARRMAAALAIPAPFLGKCLQPLVARGLLESQRGRNGGFRLAVPPEAVSLFQIVDALEPLGGVRSCFLGQDECSDERACPLHGFWKRTWSEFIERMTETTLRDLVAFCEEKPGSGYPYPVPR